jgi:hypothetical protein
MSAIVCVVGAARTALAQLGDGFLRWELSPDDGQTWHSGVLEVPHLQASVRVRAIAGWSSSAGYMFAYAEFDALWRGLENAGMQDSLVDLERNPRLPGPFGHHEVVSRFGADIKIDDDRDTLPPGVGRYGVRAGQPPEQVIHENEFSNPVFLFSYVALLDGSPGERTATSLQIAPSQGNTTDRFMRIYTTSSGATNIPLATLTQATLRVLPCPADFNRDGAADFFDYLDFAAAFASEDSSADISGNGQVDFFDYLDFVQVLSEGC